MLCTVAFCGFPWCVFVCQHEVAVTIKVTDLYYGIDGKGLIQEVVEYALLSALCSLSITCWVFLLTGHYAQSAEYPLCKT